MKDHGLLILGLFEGFLSAILGIGGGTILVPALILIFKYNIKDAVGTSLAAIAPPVTVAIISHMLIAHQNFQWLYALVLIIGALIGSRIGVLIEQKIRGKYLTVFFAILLLITSLKLLGIISIATSPALNGHTYYWLVFLGLIAGFCSALFGIGGGAVLVPSLILFFNLSIHQAVATSLLVIFPTVVFGAMFHNKYHPVNVKTVKLILPTALIGAVFGAIVSTKLTGAFLTTTFGIILLLVSTKLLLQKYTIGNILRKSLTLLNIRI